MLGALATAGLAGCLGGGDRSGAPTVESLAVGGSPGGPVALEPPDEPVLLDFFATWCAPCVPQMAELRTVHDRVPALHVRSITNESDRDAVAAFWREHEGTWPVALDPDLATNERYDVRRIPTKILLDADGERAWRHTGLAPAADILAAVEEARA